MANYKKTQDTKNKILQACRKLFYEKGYVNTYYQDICKATNLSSGVINYHFQNKSNMASIVFEEFILHNNNFISDLLDNRYSLEIVVAVQFRNYFHFILTNENIKRFYYEISKARINLDSDRLKKSVVDYYKHINEVYQLHLSNTTVKFISLSLIATEIEIFLNYINGYIDTDHEKIIDFILSYMYELLRIDYKHIDEIIKSSSKIYSKINVHLNDLFQLKLISMKDFD